MTAECSGLQLCKWGVGLDCFGDNPMEVKRLVEDHFNRPWWWLWICGYRVCYVVTKRGYHE